MVAVLLVALLATMIVPRMTGMDRRTFELAVDQTADLLMMFAQRDNIGQKSIGLWHDYDGRGRNELCLMVLDDEAGTGESDWRFDPFVKPVKFPEVVDGASLAVYADDEYIDIRELPCRLRHTPGEDRPSLELVLQSVDGGRVATLILPQYAVAPIRAEEADILTVRRRHDLDAAGRSREDW